MDFIEELKWRGMIHDIMPGTEELLAKGMTTGYVGFDPTADSLHIGHLCGIMILRHFQRAGHKPIALLGGATGMIGDPSGKSQERNLLDEPTLRRYQEALGKQLAKFLDFDSNAPNKAELVNNYDWMSKFSFLDFAREIGKHITVNYMMAKDSVQKRLNGEARDGLSFTEFSYQLLQGYDFLHLFTEKGCRLQMGGSDQWGNITTGTELIRRKTGSEAFALTSPLITKADGTKFGKTEGGNVWLDPKRTSPYKFYQFWLNVSDKDAERYLKIFTFITREELAELSTSHAENPKARLLQKRLAEEVTTMVHGHDNLIAAIEASKILFSNEAGDILRTIDESTLMDIFGGVPQFDISKDELSAGIGLLDLLAVKTSIFPSKGEARKMVAGGGVSINKHKVTDPTSTISTEALLQDKYLLVQKGKKNYFLLHAV